MTGTQPGPRGWTVRHLFRLGPTSAPNPVDPAAAGHRVRRHRLLRMGGPAGAANRPGRAGRGAGAGAARAGGAHRCRTHGRRCARHRSGRPSRCRGRKRGRRWRESMRAAVGRRPARRHPRPLHRARPGRFRRAVRRDLAPLRVPHRRQPLGGATTAPPRHPGHVAPARPRGHGRRRVATAGRARLRRVLPPPGRRHDDPRAAASGRRSVGRRHHRHRPRRRVLPLHGAIDRRRAARRRRGTQRPRLARAACCRAASGSAASPSPRPTA